MKSEYKRDMNHHYLILTGEEAIDTNYRIFFSAGFRG